MSMFKKYLSVLFWSFLTQISGNEVLWKPFVAVWNAPSAVCEEKFGVVLNLTMFDIVANRGQALNGNDMVIFYEPKLGLYPKISENGTFINGGLPQLADFPRHFDKSKFDIEEVVQNKTFSGLVVIDWESWRPIFKRNLYNREQKQYVDLSIKYMEQKHPQWNKQKIYQLTEYEFEFAARILMEGTLRQGKHLRSLGYWGFYGFPRCYNYKPGESHCANDTEQYNNRLAWLFSASSSLYPSIYLDDDFSDENKLRVGGILRESLRVRDDYSSFTPIYVYTRYRYRVSEEYYTKADLVNTISQSFDAGMDGIVMWEESKFFKTKSNCLTIQNYLDKVLGPLIKEIAEFALSCSISLCNGNGKCVNANWHDDSPWKSGFMSWNVQNYKCRCYKNWTGKHCNKKWYWQ